ncbi:MAG: type secretion system minor pseudopilin GspI [Pseudomonadota bacterium]|jgi:general secretion pathway protein I
MKSKFKQQGFSLIEIIAAFTIAAVSLTLLMRMFGTGLATIDTAQDYSRAVLIAQSKLAMVGNEIKLDEGGASGEELEGRYQWAVQILDYTVPEVPVPEYASSNPLATQQPVAAIPTLAMKQLVATVSYAKTGAERGVVRLSSYKAAPLP